MIDVEDVKEDFPVLENRDIVYLDNAATTFNPLPVTRALMEYYNEFGTSVHRGIYQLANQTTEKFEGSRAKVADFISANSSREIVFTRNSTEALNLLAYSFHLWPEKKGEILVTQMDHHSNILSWQIMVSGSPKFQLKQVNVKRSGRLDLKDFKKKLSSDTVVVALPGISNVVGAVNPIKQVIKLSHEVDALVVLDGAQWLPHRPFDLSDYDVDFLAFSAHKMLGPTGLGVLYGREELLRQMPPPFGGGEMVRTVTEHEIKWNDLPQKFEAGTPPIAQVIAFGAALEYLDNLGMQEISDHVDSLTRKTISRLSKMPGTEIYGPGLNKPRGGLVSFNVEGIHPHDLATALDSLDNIAIRAGLHCAQPLHQAMGLNATARVSFYIYNNMAEIDKFIHALKEAKEILGVQDER